uniref:uncharacterized protein LOC120345829 isoform X2 n=1 Tax=Styela clava TaxID=7725 RepID=UPI001939BD2A|nr:uncharacterized protein LOC120345829 isoform X2 [Styela clava]
MEDNKEGLSVRRGSCVRSLRPILSPKPWTNLSQFGEKRTASYNFDLRPSLNSSPARERKHSWRDDPSLNVHLEADIGTRTQPRGIKSKSWAAGPVSPTIRNRPYRKISAPLRIPNSYTDNHPKPGLLVNGSRSEQITSQNVDNFGIFERDKNALITRKSKPSDQKRIRPKVRHHGSESRFRRRKSFEDRIHNNGRYDSSSEEEQKQISHRDRKFSSSSTPSSNLAVSLAEELNSPVLQKKLQRAIARRSNSENNFIRQTRKIRVEGCMYKLTMEPASLCNSADDEVLNSSPDAPKKRQAIQNVGHRTGSIGSSLRSGSVPEAILRKQSSALQRQSSYSQKEMRQAQKWVSEREEQARQIDLTKPIRLPPTEEQIGTRNGKTNSNEQDELILPCVDKREALDCAALRLRRITQEVENGQISPQIMKDTLQYAISVLEMKFLNRTSYSDDDSDADASLQGDSVVPPEIKRWLMQTFSTSGIDGKSKRKGERRTLRSVVHVMQAGMFVERMFRKSSAAANMNISPDIQHHLRGIGRWRFDVFELEDISGGNALKYTLYEVLSKYDFIRKYKISPKALFAFAERLQIGYKKHNNQYHNPTHAADVTQCISVFLNESGFINWLSDLEVFAMIFAGAIHDLEHTGTTNNFHTQTRSSLALLYNDKSVLENHHVSAAFRILWEDPECDILGALSKDDYKQFRELVIEMVLATDMSLHFGQIKNMKSMLLHPENMERSKAMALMMHCADINHPTRPWNLHHRYLWFLSFQDGHPSFWKNFSNKVTKSESCKYPYLHFVIDTPPW